MLCFLGPRAGGEQGAPSRLLAVENCLQLQVDEQKQVANPLPTTERSASEMPSCGVRLSKRTPSGATRRPIVEPAVVESKVLSYDRKVKTLGQKCLGQSRQWNHLHSAYNRRPRSTGRQAPDLIRSSRWRTTESLRKRQRFTLPGCKEFVPP